MLFESIIITGTSCAGKSTIAKKLCELTTNNGIRFEQVKAVTTREKRADDSNYEYVNNEVFDKLLRDKKLLVESTYRDEKYGIKKAEYDKVVRKESIPVLVITPTAAVELLDKYQEKYMCIFLDAQDETLIERWIERSREEPNKKRKKEFCK